MLDEVTFGITAFNRPVHLEQLVASILVRYPRARIVVADNGTQKARLPEQVRVLHLPFDVGLSRTRNALIDTLQTNYLLILEDDFLFTDETQIEGLLEILEGDPEVGVVGGALRSRNGRVSAYSLDIEIFRKTFYVRESAHRVRISPAGLPYRICDVIWNFALFRGEMLRQHRWDDQLKVGEHAPYFHQVKLAGQWRVASCPSIVLYHVPDHRNREYQQYRERAQQMFRWYLKRYGLSRYQRIAPKEYVDDAELRPSVVVMGVGHSGTSVLAKMLHAAGWQALDADQDFGESVSIRDWNQYVQRHGRLPLKQAWATLEKLPRPWAIKDPRFVMTLHHWLPLFAALEQQPVLLRIVRDRQQVEASYQKRGIRGDLRLLVDQRLQLCQRQYDRWPWRRLTVEYERLGEAAALFDLARLAAVEPAPAAPPHQPLGPWNQNPIPAAQEAGSPEDQTFPTLQGFSFEAGSPEDLAFHSFEAGSPEDHAFHTLQAFGLEAGSPEDRAFHGFEAGSPEDIALRGFEAGSPEE